MNQTDRWQLGQPLDNKSIATSEFGSTMKTLKSRFQALVILPNRNSPQLCIKFWRLDQADSEANNGHYKLIIVDTILTCHGSDKVNWDIRMKFKNVKCLLNVLFYGFSKLCLLN